MEEYRPEHYAQIKDWCEKREIFAPPENCLPPTGIVVPGVACGFLITTSNNFGILDFYISNPVSSFEERQEALDEITNELIETAKDLGLINIVCDSKFPAIESLAIKHEFISTGTFKHFARSL